MSVRFNFSWGMKLENIDHYLGVEMKDALEMAEQTEI
jgi:hypothetical protein